MNKLPKIALLLGICAVSGAVSTANAQDKKAAPKAKTAEVKTESKGKKMADGYILLPSGLEYKIVKHGTGKKKPMLNDHIEMNIVVHEKDSVIFDSRKMNDNKPVPLPISAPKYNGDVMEGFMMMVVGDSAIFRVSVDSLKKIGGMQPWMKPGDKLEYNVKLLSLKSDEEEKKENAEHSAKQTIIDDKTLQEYFAKNNIKPMKTADGLYYTISKEGVGEHPKVGESVSVDYTGKFLNGEKFDSNTDSNFHHMQAFTLEVGKGRVIKGWDEGLLLLKKGTKATFYIPSGLAYGAQDRKPIPANSILVFDVEITDIMTPGNQPATDDKMLTEFFAKNNIKANKTADGLYYKVIEPGTGENPKAGQKVTMMYLGKLLNGKVFDGNMDENFKSTKDKFTFTLGVGQVIKGWDEGVAMLKKGEKATLYIPSGLGYGERGAGGAIPPNAVLIFDVQVMDIE